MGGQLGLKIEAKRLGGNSWPRVKCLVTSASTTTMSRSEMPGVFDVDLISEGVVVNTKSSVLTIVLSVNCLVGDQSCSRILGSILVHIGFRPRSSELKQWLRSRYDEITCSCVRFWHKSMAGRGRGRGKTVSFDVQALGFGRGEALPAASIQPPPLFPVSVFLAMPNL